MSIDIVAVDNFADLQVDRHDVAVSANDKLLRSVRRGSIHLCRRPSTEKKNAKCYIFSFFFFHCGPIDYCRRNNGGKAIVSFSLRDATDGRTRVNEIRRRPLSADEWDIKKKRRRIGFRKRIRDRLHAPTHLQKYLFLKKEESRRRHKSQSLANAESFRSVVLDLSSHPSSSFHSLELPSSFSPL